jgi:hypothetical protein
MTPAKSSFPLAISADRRYLVDQEGKPFLIHGDTAWSIISALTKDEAELYLANRAAKGFNAIIVNLVEHKFNGPLNRYGEHPFKNPEDLSIPNDNYFDHADWVIQRAADYGIVVFLAPLYLGYKHKANDDGWYHEAHISGMNKCWKYGQYVGKRYTRFNNIVWMMGGDRNPDGVVDEVNSLIQGIKDYDTHALFAAHAHPDETTAERYGWGGWLDLNSTYTYQIVHKKLLLDYNRKPVMPFILMETTYEGEHNASAVQIRRQAYWATLCGACGQFLGNRPTWLFDPGWQSAIDAVGSQDMVHLKAFYTSRPWFNLVPDQKHEVLTDGLGEFNGMDYLTAARTADGSTLMAYMPTARTVTIDMSKLSGSKLSAWWFDPGSGDAQPAGEFQTTGVQQLTPPGEGDWCLVIDNKELNLPSPGR